MHLEGDKKNAEIGFTLSCKVANDVPANMLADVKIIVFSKNRNILASHETSWGAPHKRMPPPAKTYYKNASPQRLLMLPYELIRVSIPYESLADVAFLKLHICELIHY
jgi:hypothetical protein